MSKETRQFMEQLKSGEQPTLIEAIKEAAASMKEIGGRIWDEAEPMFSHGSTELAKALFSEHSGHVLYMNGQEGGDKSKVEEQVKEPPEHQRDDGREM